MEKTFNINSEIANTILKSYQDFLKIKTPESKFKDRVLDLLSELDIEKLSEVLEKALHASLKKEEGKHHDFSIILSPPENKFNDLREKYYSGGDFDDVSTFEKPVDIELLHKIAPAFELTNRKLRIWFDDKGHIEIWGFASRYFNYFGIEIKSFSPGQLLIHIKCQDFPYERYLITFSETKRVIRTDNLIELLFDESEIAKLNNPSDKKNFERIHLRKNRRHWFLIDLINKIMNHKHGGTVFFIPQEHSEEILNESNMSILYQPKEGYKYIEFKFIREENEIVHGKQTGMPSPRLFEMDANFLAQITAVDGASILNKDFRVLGFGAKIKVKQILTKENKLTNVWIKEPFENFKEEPEELDKLGGMRHQSTAQFIFDQRERNIFAIVASEDGKVSIMYWDENKKMVTVMRHVEYLFYGMNI